MDFVQPQPLRADFGFWSRSLLYMSVTTGVSVVNFFSKFTMLPSHAMTVYYTLLLQALHESTAHSYSRLVFWEFFFVKTNNPSLSYVFVRYGEGLFVTHFLFILLRNLQSCYHISIYWYTVVRVFVCSSFLFLVLVVAATVAVPFFLYVASHALY